MSSHCANSFSNSVLDLVGSLGVVEKRNMLLPRQAHKQQQAPLGCNVKHPTGRRRIQADRVDARGGHQREIALDNFPRVIFGAVALRAKWSVRDAFDIKLLIASPEEFASDSRTG